MFSIKSARISLILCVLMGTALAWGPARVIADPTVSIQPPQLIIGEGGTATFSVSVDSTGDPISCFIVQIHYDPAVIQVTQVEQGPLYALSGLPTYPDSQLIAPDTLQISDCVLGFGTFILGPGSMADVTVAGLIIGSSPIELAFAQVRDIDRIPYGAIGVEHGEVLVVEPSAIGGDAGVPRVDGDLRLRIAPNPAPGWARIEILGATGAGGDLALRGGTVVDIYDVAGRLQRSLHGRTVGDLRLDWDGHDQAGSPLPAGLYLARVRGIPGVGAKLLLVR